MMALQDAYLNCMIPRLGHDSWLTSPFFHKGVLNVYRRKNF